MTRRLLLDRLLRPIAPAPDARFTPPPARVAAGLWTIERRVRLAGAALPSRSTVVQVGEGRLLVVSPPADPCPELAAIGAVSAIVAPNSFHHLHAAAWLRRHPEAALYVAPGLPRRVPGLPPAVELTETQATPWRDALPYVLLGPDRGLAEVLFFHRASRTLILTDVASNLVDVPRARDRLAFRLLGMPAGFGPSRNARRLFLRNEAVARAALRAASRWPFERIVVAHGAIVERGARDAFASAFAAWT